MVNDVYDGIRQIKKEALEDNIPIMQDETIDFITNYIVTKGIKKILEIGTATGYSAIMMSLANPLVRIVTIEKDKDRYIKALKNVKRMNLEDRITLIFNDAVFVITKKKG